MLPLQAAQQSSHHGELTPVQQADHRRANGGRLIPCLAGAEDHPLLANRAVQRPNLLESTDALRDQRTQRDNQRCADRGHEHTEHVGADLGDQ
jgi:hypothetical protein